MTDDRRPPLPPRERLILGLGNPGERYRETRHNLGFQVIEELARRRGVALGRLVCQSRVAELPETLLAMPQTYMNRSGYAARCLLELRGLRPADVLVVYDDLHLPLGRLRLRLAGSPGGHRGMESVLENLRTDEVARLRLGIAGPAGSPAGGEGQVDFVLSPFSAGERDDVREMVGRAADACESWLREGGEAAMNRFNG